MKQTENITNRNLRLHENVRKKVNFKNILELLNVFIICEVIFESIMFFIRETKSFKSAI